MYVLGIDLASRRYSDIGVALVYQQEGKIGAELIRPASAGLSDPPQVEALAHWVAILAARHQVQVIAVDGPQAWKAQDNGLDFARACERQLRTQAKTGLPGVAKPSTSLRFVRFAIEFFDALDALGWPRLDGFAAEQPLKPVAIEVFPTAAWRALGLSPLPSKAATQPGDVTTWLHHLQGCFPLLLSQMPSHDELQALMAGLVALALADGELFPVCRYGLPLVWQEASWREGYIVNFQSGRTYASLE